MDQGEVARLQAYLRRLLGASTLNVKRTGGDEADVLVGETKVADLTKDEDEGELSYFFNMGLVRAKGAARTAPLDEGEKSRLQALLNETFGTTGIELRARPRKTDSVEAYVGDEFIGTVSSDEQPGHVGYFLTMSILDIDLEDSD